MLSKRLFLLCKKERFSDEATRLARRAFGPWIEVYSGAVGDPEPKALSSENPGTVISFLSPWIVRKETLDRCDLAINFHLGSADYPGTGCYNFALYEDAADFGAVCHHMLPKVDTGRIIEERRFPVMRGDSVETLKLRTMETMIAMFAGIIEIIANGAALPASTAHWTRKPFTRAQMEALKVIQSIMPPEEVQRRVRATVYPGYPGPVMHHNDGSTFTFPVPNRPALA